MDAFHFHADADSQALTAAIHAVAGADAEIETIDRQGRFARDVTVWVRESRETSARFCRALAKALGRAVLFSDCSAFPFSYFLADPDGAIWSVLLAIGDDDVMDLAPDYTPLLSVPAEEALPERPAGAPVSWTQDDTMCERHAAGRPCRVFAGPCRKRTH